MYTVLVPCFSLLLAATATPPQPSFYGQAERDAWSWQHQYGNQQGPHQGQAGFGNADQRHERHEVFNPPQHPQPYGNQTSYHWFAGRYDGQQYQPGQHDPPSATAPAPPSYPPPPPPPPSNAMIAGPPAAVPPLPPTFHHAHSFPQNFSHQHPQSFHQGPSGPVNGYPQHQHPAPAFHPPINYQPPVTNFPVAINQQTPVQRPALPPPFAHTHPQQQCQQPAASQLERQPQPPRPIPREEEPSRAEAGARQYAARGNRDRTRDHLSPHLGSSRRERLRGADRVHSTASNIADSLATQRSSTGCTPER